MSVAPKVPRRLLCALPCVGALLLASSTFAGRNANEVRSVDSQEKGGDTKILIRGTSTPTFTVYKLDRPARVVVDVSNAVMSPRLDRDDGEKKTWQVNTWAVGNVSAHAVGSARGSVVRVVVGLARPGSYKVEAVGDDVQVTITPRDAPPADTSAAHRAEAKHAMRTAEAAKAEAARARAEAASAEEQAARAKVEAEQAKQRTAAAEAEIEQLKRTLAKARTEAQRMVERARSDAETAQREARERARVSEQQLAEASTKMKEADRQLAEAKRLEREAARAKREALSAERDAEKRERAATEAAKRASERQAEAERAAVAAKRYEKEAARLGADDARLAALRKRAEDAAREAEERRTKAESAARMSEMRRKEAEAAAAAAEARRQKAVEATGAAERERLEAEQRRETAVSQREQAEARQKEAEQRAAEAQAAADKAMAVAGRAKALREKEEAAYRRATQARSQAETRQKDIVQATEQLEATLAAARQAEAMANKRRAQADAARREAENRRTAGDVDALAKARAQAEQLEKATAAADAELAVRRSDVNKQKKVVARLQKDVDEAAAELGKLKLAAKQARAAREKEEQQLEAIAAEREAAQKELQRARLAREQAERAAAEAEKLARAAKKEQETLGKKKAARSRVRNVEFEDHGDVARVTLALSSPAKPRIVRKRGKRVILEIDGATIPENLERTLDTTRYRGPVRAISSYRDPAHPTKVRVEVQLSQPTENRLAKVGNIYHWDFQKPARQEAKAKTPKSSPKKVSRTSTSTAPIPVVGGFASSSTPITQQTVAQLSRGNAKVYRGTKIDLDFKDADIHNLLRLLADVGGVNIVIPDEIKYRVTVRMRRVPWDQALEVILASKGLWYERNGNLYRIAPRKELDAEAQAEAERRAAMAKSEPPGTDYITLNYTPARDVEGQIKTMLSPKGSIQVDKRTNTVVIVDVKANRNNILELLRRLDTPTPQIQIEARVVEARSSFAREVGIQWGGSAVASGPTGNSTGLVFPNSVALAGGADDNQASSGGVAITPPDFAVNMPAAVGAGSGGALGLSLGSVGGNFALNLRLSAMETEGTVRIVSAPKITVLNNTQATISQGVSIPVSVVSANGVQTQFVPADLSLQVTPSVSQADCAVTLDLNITKNEADFGNTGARGDPSILRKEAKTKVLVADGATTVIGGIYTRNTGLNYSKVPFFADLPVFGWFFKTRSESDNRTEVLVFITPKITNRAHLRCERPIAPR